MKPLLNLCLTLVLCMSASFSVLAQDSTLKKVAVYVTGDVADGIKKVIGSKLVLGTTRSSNYTAVERTGDFLGELMKEQDYQTSGAVTDSQIARIGQQFGVEYVLAADVSEIFGSMFISARMIDVQTAEIVNSADATQVVSDMNGLTSIAEKIVSDVLWTKKFSEDDIMKISSGSTVRALRELQIPDGYRKATLKEINDLIIDSEKSGKRLSFPIYTDINSNYNLEYEYYTINYYKDKNTRKTVSSEQEYRIYHRYEISFITISERGESKQDCKELIIDDNYRRDYSPYNYPPHDGYWGAYTSGLYNRARDPFITSGYVYLIKIKESN